MIHITNVPNSKTTSRAQTYVEGNNVEDELKRDLGCSKLHH